jgi:tRNA dimethylallyltransferase
MPETIICLMGPTASGKTALACELVSRFPFEIISVDSAMIYRGMDIGTAKPSPEELLRAPHHLIDIKDPIEAYSAAQFCDDTLLLCESILQRGKKPLLVGGTMMYFNALQQGLSVLPQANEDLRQTLEQEAMQKGWAYMHAKLAAVDPQTAARVHAHDTQRIQRALEVYHTTGIPLSQCLGEKKTSSYHFASLALFPQDRAWLHQGIAQRFLQMLTMGFIEEVEGLLQQWPLHPQLPAMRCVGYRQVFDYLQGLCDRAQLPDKGIAATRQLAKRQLTWLRHWEDICYYDPQTPDFTDRVIAKITEILDNEHS